LKVFGDNQINGNMGQFSFDRDDEYAARANYYSAFKKFNSPPDLSGRSQKRRTNTAAGTRTKYKDIVQQESVNPTNMAHTTPKFIPARHKFLKDKGDSYESLYATRLASTAVDSKQR